MLNIVIYTIKFNFGDFDWLCMFKANIFVYSFGYLFLVKEIIRVVGWSWTMNERSSVVGKLILFLIDFCSIRYKVSMSKKILIASVCSHSVPLILSKIYRRNNVLTKLHAFSRICKKLCAAANLRTVKDVNWKIIIIVNDDCRVLRLCLYLMVLLWYFIGFYFFLGS